MAHGGAAVPRRSRDATWRRPVGATYAVGYGAALEVAGHGTAEAAAHVGRFVLWRRML